MSRTVESIVAAHRAGRERRAAGQPAWEYRVHLGHVFHDEALTFEQRRDEIVRVLTRSRWVRDAGEGSVLAQLVEELGDTPDPAEFDEVWDAIYDEANVDRAWIETTARATP